MSNYYPIFASPDSEPVDYYCGLSGLDCPLVEADRNTTKNPSRGRRGSTRAFAFAIIVLLTGVAIIVGLVAVLDPQKRHRLIFPAFGIRRDSIDPDTDISSTEQYSQEGRYAVDVSWPIYGPLRKEQSVFREGARHEAYMRHLQGCRGFYKQVSQTAARTCDLFEFDRLLMNKRQPQSMEVTRTRGYLKLRNTVPLGTLILTLGLHLCLRSLIILELYRCWFQKNSGTAACGPADRKLLATKQGETSCGSLARR